MAPDDLATILYRLTQLEKHQDELRTKDLPEMLSHGRAWHASMMTGLANLQSSIVQVQERLPELYSPRREAEERHRVVNERLTSLDHRTAECRRDHEAAMERHQDDHREAVKAHQTVHDRANDEHMRLLYWAAGAGLTAGLALLQAVTRFIPGTH